MEGGCVPKQCRQIKCSNIAALRMKRLCFLVLSPTLKNIFLKLFGNNFLRFIFPLSEDIISLSLEKNSLISLLMSVLVEVFSCHESIA